MLAHTKRLQILTTYAIISSSIGKEKVVMRKLSYNPLWKKLIDLRWTKTELAEKAGISRSTIAKMRKDEPVALDVIVKIANAIDCDVVDIIEILPE